MLVIIKETSNNELIIENFNNITNWINDPRVIGKKYKKVEIFFEVQIRLSVLNLVRAQLEYCDQYRIGVYSKFTDLEHIKQIGFTIGINIKLASITWYRKKIERILNITKRIIKIRKEIVY